MAIAAVIDKGGLQRRLDPRHLGQIDVTAELLTVGGLEVEFLDAIAAQDDHPGLLGVGRIDQHLVGHCLNSCWRSGTRLSRDATGAAQGGATSNLPDS